MEEEEGRGDVILRRREKWHFSKFIEAPTAFFLFFLMERG